MSFYEKVAALTQRLPSVVEHLETEEATKNALILPFIAALGYDVFNPREVVPEFTADVGLKKGEKVDYAIMKENEFKRNEVIILIECKKVKTDLSQAEMSQLYRYFAVTKARIAILTNGVQYWFYSDLEEPNKMDQRPFLVLDMADPRKNALVEVKRLAKDEFDLDKMLSAANELKYTSEFQRIFAAQLEKPDDELVRFFYTRGVPGARFTTAAKEQYAPLVSKALNQLVNDRINDRLRSALQSENGESKKGDAPADEPSEDPQNKGIVTTEQEMEGFRVVRAILCRAVPLDRVVLRDNKSYCGILLDDNNRKPICRLWFNSKQWYLGVFDCDKNETKIPIESVASIYQYADTLLGAVEAYQNK